MLRKLILAGAVLALLTGAAYAQFPMPSISLGKDKPPPTAEEIERQKAIDNAYNSATKKIPDKTRRRRSVGERAPEPAAGEEQPAPGEKQRQSAAGEEQQAALAARRAHCAAGLRSSTSMRARRVLQRRCADFPRVRLADVAKW